MCMSIGYGITRLQFLRQRREHMRNYPHCLAWDDSAVGPLGGTLYIRMLPIAYTAPELELLSREPSNQVQLQKPRILLSTYDMIRQGRSRGNPHVNFACAAIRPAGRRSRHIKTPSNQGQ